jgi:hypothetical protein
MDVEHTIEEEQSRPSKKFRTVTENDEKDQVEAQKKRKNEEKNPEVGVKLLKNWLVTEKSEHRNPPEELDRLVANFILSMKTPKIDEYEPDSLVNKLNSISRYLREHNYTTNINQDNKFRHSRKILTAKVTERNGIREPHTQILT